MIFNDVAQIFEKIEKTSSRLGMTQELANLFKKAPAKEINILCNLSLDLLRPLSLSKQ